MGLALTLARRSFGAHPGRALFSILGVAVGIATGVAVFTLDHVTVLVRAGRAESSGADLEVRASPEHRDPRGELLAMEGVAGVAAFFQNDVRVRVPTSAELGLAAEASDGRPPAVARLVALEEGAGRTLGVYHVERGDDLGTGPGSDVLLGRALAEELALAPGDSVWLSPPARAAKAECVEGVLLHGEPAAAPREERFRVAGILAPEGVGRASKGRVALIGYEAGRALYSDVFVEAQFWLARDGAVDLEELEARLAKGFTFQHDQARAVGQMADERAFRNGVRVAGLFALLLGLFVIFHTLSMSLIERVREVGALTSLSASRLQIARVFFTEALVIAMAAGGLGLAGGLLLAKLLLGLGFSTLGMGPPTRLVDVPWHTVLLLAGLGVAIALLGSVYPILRLRSTDVVALLRGDDPVRRGARHSFHLFSTLLLVGVVPAAFFRVVPVVGAADRTLVSTLLLGLIVLGLLIGVPLLLPRLVARASSALARRLARRSVLVARLTGRNLEESPGRVGASISAMALVTAAFVGLKGMTASLAGETEVWGETALADRLLVEHLPDASLPEVRELLHRQPEVLGVEAGDARAFPSFLLLGQPAAELERHGPLADPALARAFHEEQGIVLSQRLARQRGLGAGDQVLVNTSGHGVQSFRVLAVSDAYGYFFHPDERAYGVIDERFLVRYFCTDVTSTASIAVKLAPGASPEAAVRALEERFPTARLKTYDGPGLVRIMLHDLTVDFLVFDVILLLTALLSAVGVLNGQLLAAIQRQKELGILRALGALPGQIGAVVLLEALVIGCLGGFLGALVGLGLTPVLVSALSVLSGLELPLCTAGAWVPFAISAAIGLSVAAGLYPVLAIRRWDAVRAVRTG